MNPVLRQALLRVADVLDATAEALSADASDLVWFNIDAAIDEAIEAIDGEPDGPVLCDRAGEPVPAARRRLAAGDVPGAAQALRDAARALRERTQAG